MTRAGVGYVAMAAAGISAAVLGYAVIWSYEGGPEPAIVSAPPGPAPHNPKPIASPDATVQARAEVSPNPVVATPSAPVSAPPTTTQPTVETTSRPVSPPVLPPQQEPARDVTSPTSPSGTADVIAAPPDRKIEKPQTATAAKDAHTAASVTRTVAPPKTESLAALTSTDRPQAASQPLKPPAQEAAKTEIAEPSPRAAEKPMFAQPSPNATPPESSAIASPSQPVTKSADLPQAVAPPNEVLAQTPLPSTESAQPSSSKLAAAAPTSSADNSASMPASPERVVNPRLRHFYTAPPQREQRSAIAPSLPALSQLPASPQPESPALVAPAAPPPISLALAPPPEKAEPPLAASPVLPKTPDRPAKTLPRAPAPPSATTAGRPTIIRGSRRSVTHKPVSKPRAPEPQKQRVAALPAGSAAARTATDAPSILVLRGARGVRYALAPTAQAPPEPLLTVIRGARPRPAILQPYVPPNALVLHIRH